MIIKTRYDMIVDLIDSLNKLKPIDQKGIGGCILLSLEDLKMYSIGYPDELIIDVQISLNKIFRDKKMPFRAVINTLKYPIRIYRKK